MAAERLGVEVDGLRFVARPGMVLDPLAEKPDVVGSDLSETADQILQVERA